MTDWAQAKCLNRPDLDWDTPTGPDAETCRRICRACPIQTACAQQRAKTAEYDRDAARCRQSRSCYVHGCRRRICVRAHRRYITAQRRNNRQRSTPPPALTRPYGRGRHRAMPGQLLLFTL